MKTILALTDFSECANNAVNFAVQSAKILPAEIILLHAFNVQSDLYTEYVGLEKEFNNSLHDDASKKLLDIKTSIEETEQVTVSTKLFKGTVKDAVEEAVGVTDVDLIVMGAMGASWLKEKLWGSTTASIIGSTDVPVMAVPHGYEWKKPEKMLLATNHFEKEPDILNYIFEMADLYMARLQVTVFTGESEKTASSLAHFRNIPKYEKLLQRHYPEDTLTISHLYGPEFEETLQKYIKEKEIDILVMITYQEDEGIWSRLFHPSKTKSMSYHTSIPLLAIPA
ncbi:universal stress protein [Chitinophaga sp. CF418]|uniref:universal stress protein n=1 Tax=Chitinophaga sp. CF418 TaxID=1855287 RepID=UPI00091E37B2|nr:universal stress protein [Chitinophaga sp. CF418]SHN25090.1 Nucleotide-binding universal stress protein, UspA family [Chitinophaga sp. CF418]